MKLENLFHIMLIIFLTFYGCRQDERKKEPAIEMLIWLSADNPAVELYNSPQHVIV